MDRPVTQKGPDIRMLIHQLMQPVKVTVQSFFEYSHYQNAPQGHTRAAIVQVHPGEHLLLQQFKQGGAGGFIGIEMLQSQQQGRNIIS